MELYSIPDYNGMQIFHNRKTVENSIPQLLRKLKIFSSIICSSEQIIYQKRNRKEYRDSFELNTSENTTYAD